MLRLPSIYQRIAYHVPYTARFRSQVPADGCTHVQATRLFDGRNGTSRSVRAKEEAHEYRYVPDPDLLPLDLYAGWAEEIKVCLPELPDDKKARFVKDF